MFPRDFSCRRRIRLSSQRGELDGRRRFCACRGSKNCDQRRSIAMGPAHHRRGCDLPGALDSQLPRKCSTDDRGEQIQSSGHRPERTGRHTVYCQRDRISGRLLAIPSVISLPLCLPGSAVWHGGDHVSALRPVGQRLVVLAHPSRHRIPPRVGLCEPRVRGHGL